MISFGKKAMKRASASIVILPIGIVTSFWSSTAPWRPRN
jgi:hypothetical protein